MSSEPYQNRLMLFSMHLAFTFTARMWDMAVTLFLAELSNNSLSVISCAGIFNTISVIFCMPSIGTYLDKSDRLTAANSALGVKLVTVSTAYILFAFFLYEQSVSGQVAPLPSLAVMIILTGMSGLAFSAVSQSVEKDWIVVLSNGSSDWLTSTNSIMTQIDSACNSLAPAATGILLTTTSMTYSALVLLTVNCVSVLMLLFFMRELYSSWPALAVRAARQPPAAAAKDTVTIQLSNIKPRVSKGSGNNGQTKSLPSYQALARDEEQDNVISSPVTIDSELDQANSSINIQSKELSAWTEFFRCESWGTMIAYSFLYLTVLNFGGLLTVYLRYTGVSDAWIGAARGGGAISGLLGAMIFPFLVRCIGLRPAAGVSIVWQTCLVILAAVSFLFPSAGVIVLCICVVSAACLVMFDLLLLTIECFVL